MKVKELFGKEIIDANAKVVGYIKDVVIDEKKWVVTGIVVKAGFIRKLTIQVADVDKVGDKVVLKAAIDKIQKT
ncbi:MAG: PRC-barrel domain-containing protein [Chloroflexi bacterium]|nr:PRC-barrel domain-containing protein [Chloroflexota bacterium]